MDFHRVRSFLAKAKSEPTDRGLPEVVRTATPETETWTAEVTATEDSSEK